MQVHDKVPWLSSLCELILPSSMALEDSSRWSKDSSKYFHLSSSNIQENYPRLQCLRTWQDVEHEDIMMAIISRREFSSSKRPSTQMNITGIYNRIIQPFLETLRLFKYGSDFISDRLKKNNSRQPLHMLF